HGCNKTVSVNRQDVCSECSGTGAAKGTSPETCPDCRGSGFVTVQQRTPFGVMQSSRPCSKCSGKGKIIKNPCSKCHGTGNVGTAKRVEVNVPAG
ncbi:MAG: zinc finger domain-containing protein, partial [Oscillospiraceae bacterium]